MDAMPMTRSATARSREGLDDEALVELARHRDEPAIRALVKRHNQRLFRVARSVVRNDSEAEDVVQESYARAFTHLDTFRGDSLLSTWLTRITLNEALGRLRRRRAMVDLDRIDIETGGASARVLQFPSPSAMPDPEVDAARGQIRVLLERAVDELPDGFRAAFVLRDVEGLSTEETAEQLGIKPETVKTRLHRARKLMRAALEREVADAFAGIFPFDGARCANMADRVLARMAAIDAER